VRGDGNAGIVLEKACIDQGVFSGAEAFGAIGLDAMEGGCRGLEDAFAVVVRFWSWEEEDDGKADGTSDGGMVSGHGSLLDEVTPRFDVLGRFDHATVTDMAFTPLRGGRHPGNGDGQAHVLLLSVDGLPA
jgi:hypothetical protein